MAAREAKGETRVEELSEEEKEEKVELLVRKAASCRWEDWERRKARTWLSRRRMRPSILSEAWIQPPVLRSDEKLT
jgi:hypothetical protein